MSSVSGQCIRIVPFQMERQMIRPGEGSVAHLALERPVAGVFPRMPRQLVRPREFPAAILPRADVRFLAGVRPQMSLEVGALGVGLSAARVVAGVTRGLPFDCLLRPGFILIPGRRAPGIVPSPGSPMALFVGRR